MKPAVFLDRDGVITQDPPHYAHRIDQLALIAGSAEAIRMLNEHGFLVIVITNQSGVARGMYAEKDVAIFNHEMERRLALEGARIDAVYYCPHHPDAEIPGYRTECDCRKPAPGMLYAAERDLGVSLEDSFLVGDKWSDIEAGNAVGCKPILVLTGHGSHEHARQSGNACGVAKDLLSAVKTYIISSI
jgi:D-glycero-D-manno-heptose 1,7-bisphosphate phosphatase